MAESATKLFRSKKDDSVDNHGTQSVQKDLKKPATLLESVKTHAEETLHEIDDKIGPVYDSTKETIKNAIAAAYQWAKKNPVKATFLVASAGMLIGMTANRFFTRDENKSSI